jgi:hypothetical protein
VTYTALQYAELAGCGLFALGVLGLDGWAYRAAAFARHRDAFTMAKLYCAVWALTNLLQMLLGKPWGKAANPLIDTLALAFVVWSFIRRPAWWKAPLIPLFFAQVILGAEFWLTWIPHHLSVHRPPGAGMFLRVQVAQFLLWVGEGIAIGWSGGLHVARPVLARLSRLPRRIDLAVLPGRRRG